MPNGTGPISARRAASARKRRIAFRTARHSSEVGINLQDERRRPRSLSTRRVDEDRRQTSDEPHRRTTAIRLRADGGERCGLTTPLTVKPLLSDEQVGPLWWRPKLAGFSESHA